MWSDKTLTVIFFFFSVVVLCYGANFKDCGSKVGKFNQVTVSGCDSNQPVCELVKGSNASISISFEPNENVDTVRAVVHGILGPVPIPFMLPQPLVCDDTNSGIKCPLKEHVPVTYTTSLPIKNEYPKLSVTIKWELQDEQLRDIVCVMIPAKIV